MPNTIAPNPSPSREGLTFAKIWRFISLPFFPAKLKTYMAVKRFEEIPVQRLIEDGVKGVLVDADGTLGTHLTQEYPESVVQHIREMIDNGLRVAIYTNAPENRFQQFQGASIVTQVPAKPDQRGFRIAMEQYLNVEDPAKVCMIGDNYITDGGAIALGMKFIHVQPIKGKEKFIHRSTRFIAYLFARIYSGNSFRI
ncbi:MAG: HAD family hydrolase [Nitrospinales bacterium]